MCLRIKKARAELFDLSKPQRGLFGAVVVTHAEPPPHAVVSSSNKTHHGFHSKYSLHPLAVHCRSRKLYSPEPTLRATLSPLTWAAVTPSTPLINPSPRHTSLNIGSPVAARLAVLAEIVTAVALAPSSGTKLPRRMGLFISTNWLQDEWRDNETYRLGGGVTQRLCSPRAR